MGKYRIGFYAETSKDRHINHILDGMKQAADDLNVQLFRFMETPPERDQFCDQRPLLLDIAGMLHLDGLIYLGWMRGLNQAPLAKKVFASLGVPLLCLGGCHEGIQSVHHNGYKAMAELLDHAFLVHQLTKIAFIHPIDPDDRIEGYRDYMKSHGIYDPALEISAQDLGKGNTHILPERAKAVLDVMLTKKNMKPEIIVSLFSDEAAWLLDGLMRHGFHPPHDIKVLCWEDIEASRYADVPITAMYYPFKELGAVACQNLVSVIFGEDVPLVTEVPGVLTIRSSCGCQIEAVNRIRYPQACADEPNDKRAYQQTSQATLTNPPLSILKEKIKQALATGSDAAVIDYVGLLLFECHADIGALHAFRDLVITTRDDLLRTFRDNPAQASRCDTIWLKVFLLMQNKVEQISGKLELRTFEESRDMVGLNQDIITSFQTKQIFTTFSSFLADSKINCYFYLLDEGKKDRSGMSLRYAFRDGSVYTEQAGSTGLSSFGHLVTTRAERKTVYIHLLHVKNELLGVIFFEGGPNIERIYEDVSIQLSSALKSALVVENLKTANEKLFELDRLKNDFIANITHDFRSPLMVILNSADLSLRYNDTTDSKLIRKRLLLINEASLKLKNTIDRLLELARMDNKGLCLYVREIPLDAWLAGIIDFYQSAAANTGLRIEFRHPPRTVDNFYSDPQKLEEVLNNIISNAFKFVDPATGEIIITLEDLDQKVRISIADNGIGIPQEKLETIFQRFEQIPNNLANPSKGTGIGLAFSRQLIGFLKGVIWAESNGPGAGAKFIIELPKGREQFQPEDLDRPSLLPVSTQKNRREQVVLLKAHLGQAERHEDITTIITDPNKDNEFDFKKGKILIVEDNPHIQTIEVEYLQNAGFCNFILASDGLPGIEAAYSYHPDLILCDFNLPKMNGAQFQEQLAGNPEFAHIPFIFLTALEDKTTVLERKRKGAVAYLVKPIDEADMILTVELHLKKTMELKSLLHQATIEELTGLPNRQHVLRTLTKELSIRNYRDLSVIFLDIDHFKGINDTFGHPTGDAVLAHIGQVIREIIRPYDTAGRYGGDEFIIILPETNAIGAEHVARKLSDRITSLAMKMKRKTLRLTSSFGISSLMNGSPVICRKLKLNALQPLFEPPDVQQADWPDIEHKKASIANILVEMADEALYQSKKTLCTQCGFSSLKADDFADRKCPQCHSTNLAPGRGKITVYSTLK